MILWVLLAASIPVIIHLLNRRRHRTVKWAAMQFLLKATRESRGKKRLRHILILTCRTLGIAALVFAAALPVVSSFLGLGSGRADLVVLVLDRSASMSATPKNGTIARRELALSRILDTLSDLGSARVVLIDSATGTPQEVPAPETLPELNITAGTDTAADLPGLLAATAEFLAATPGKAEVWIASDLQQSNWTPGDERWETIRATLANLPQPPRLRVLALAGDASPNQAIRIVDSRRTEQALFLDLEVTRNTNTGGPINLPVTTHLNGAATTAPVSIAGQIMTFRQKIAVPSNEAEGHGWVSIPGDGNPRDNVSFFAYGPARPIESIIVGTRSEATDYIALAAAPGGYDGQQINYVDAAALPGTDLSGIATIFWSDPLPEGPVAERIERFLEDGGQVLFFAPDTDSDSSFLGIQWSAITQADRDKFFILDSWDHIDGVMRDSIVGSPLVAEKLRSLRRRIPTGELSIFARWDDAEPFLTRSIIGRGTAWFMGSRPDYRWSNLGDGDVLLPVSQRVVSDGAKRFDSGHLAELGSSDIAHLAGEPMERLDAFTSAERSASKNNAGVFRARDRTIAINRPASEDLQGVIETSDLNQILEGTDLTFFEDTSTSARDNVSRGVWRAFLVAMLFFLLAEALLCLPKRLQPAAEGASPTGATR